MADKIQQGLTSKLNQKAVNILPVVVLIIGVLSAIFHIYVLGFSAIATWNFRAIHLMFGLLIIFLSIPIVGDEQKRHKALPYLLIDIILAGLAVLVAVYIVMHMERLILFIQFAPTTTDIVISVIGIILVLEAGRRANGPMMAIIPGIFLLYGAFGEYLPGWIGHGGYSFERLAAYSFSLDGIYGISLGIAATYMIIFVMFGAVLEGTGGDKLITRTALGAFGRFRGGPAKAAVLASAGMGTLTGHSAGNVAVTGAFTIPLMKNMGYKPTVAAAVEAVASTGGQLLPPIMGAGAFLMAETLGIPYVSVIAAAAIPALLYFTAVLFMCDLEAVKTGLKGLSKSEMPDLKEVLKSYGHLLIPVIILLYILLIERATPIRAGLYGIYSTLLIGLLLKTSRYTFIQLLHMLKDGTKKASPIITACACAGFVIGILSLTGLGARLANALIALSGGNLLAALLLTMLTAIILGMGLPTTAAYIISSTVLAPALAALGVPLLAAHLFIFFFAVISAITPPIALAAYAGAGIAGSNPNQTGYMAFKMGLAAFIIPYMFIYGEPLLGVGSFFVIGRSVVTAVIGIYFFASAINNFYLVKTGIVVRVILLIASLSMISPQIYADGIGIGLIVIATVIQSPFVRDKIKGVKPILKS